MDSLIHVCDLQLLVSGLKMKRMYRYVDSLKELKDNVEHAQRTTAFIFNL